MPPKLSEALSIEDQRALDRMIDADVEEGLHPDLRENVPDDDTED